MNSSYLRQRTEGSFGGECTHLAEQVTDPASPPGPTTLPVR